MGMDKPFSPALNGSDDRELLKCSMVNLDLGKGVKCGTSPACVETSTKRNESSSLQN
ncbi:hypothetical protein DsansV1_C07g0069141 [Dioscorea sansibarensis]